MTLRYATVCSGIEAPSAAWHELGWSPIFFSEIEAAPSAVLSQHYSDVPNRGDMTAFDTWPVESIDVLCAGTPCQSFSVAGKGKSLDDARGNLTLTFCRIADRFDPEWIVWENVPGILSKADNPFGCFLGELTGCDTPIVPGRIGWTSTGVVAGPKRTAAWRVIDAQGFVPQRRERVFVVCTRAGSRHHPADVLFETEAEAFGCLGERAYTGPLFPERESVCGDLAQGEEAGEGASCDVVGSLTSSGRGVERCGESRGQDPVIAIAPPLTSNPYGDHESREGLLVAHAPDIARCVATREGTSQDYETTTMVAHSLRADGFDASEDGTGRGTPLVPVAFNHLMGAKAGSIGAAENLAGTIGTRVGGGAIAFDWYASASQSLPIGEECPPLKTTMQPAVATAMRVRRLMPIECERLQAFRDGYTAITVKGKPMKDGPRYKMLGNSMCRDVLLWIGQRIAMAVARESEVA